MEPGQHIQEYGDSDKKLYILLNGAVSVFERNDGIINWEWAIDVYNSLRKWKKNVFDKKVKTSMRLSFEQDKIEFELELNRRIRHFQKSIKMNRKPTS